MTDCTTQCRRAADPAADPCHICADEDSRLRADEARTAGGRMPLPPDPTAGERSIGDYEWMRLRGD